MTVLVAGWTWPWKSLTLIRRREGAHPFRKTLVTFLDRSVRRISILPSKDFCSFVFEVLVNREKMLDFLQYVRLNFCVVLNAAETRIASRVSENFFIRNSLVEHFKEADWPRKVNAPRKG